MKEVAIYTCTTARSPKATKCEAVGYVIEMKTAKGDATAGDLLTVHGMTRHQAELHVLKTALARINTVCELHIHTECGYVAAGFEKWLAGWKSSGWKTRRGEEVKNAEEWKELDEMVEKHGHVLVFHVKESHSFKNWLKTNLERRKEECLKNLENSTRRKR